MIANFKAAKRHPPALARAHVTVAGSLHIAADLDCRSVELGAWSIRIPMYFPCGHDPCSPIERLRTLQRCKWSFVLCIVVAYLCCLHTGCESPITGLLVIAHDIANILEDTESKEATFTEFLPFRVLGLLDTVILVEATLRIEGILSNQH